MSATGWTLDARDRAELLDRFPPRWPDVIAHHVTLAGGASEDAPLPAPVAAQVVGVADDGVGVEALVVAIDGSTRRPDGSTFHITWSLDRAAGRRPVESNAVIAERGWSAIRAGIPIGLTPARLE